MSQQMLRDATARFFDDFVAAFQSFNGDQIAALYVVPTISLQADGRLACLLSLADVGSYFQAVVDSYHAEGCRSCQYKDLEVVPMGGRSVLGTVTWELLCNDGSVLKTWRESYNLMLLESGLRVFASTDHVG